MCELDNMPEERPPGFGRRAVLRLVGASLGVAALGGCTPRSITRRLPEPDYPLINSPNLAAGASPVEAPLAAANAGFANVLARSAWTSTAPSYSEMYRMAPVKYVTVHHDGMRKFTARSSAAAAERLEQIRSLHRNKGWADIGYHYAIDPAGRIWACRPVSWQGAHVKDRNPGNVGIVVLGNFELQRPNGAQLAALKVHLAQVQRVFSIRDGRTFGHKDWPGAATACPGRYLHPHVARL